MGRASHAWHNSSLRQIATVQEAALMFFTALLH